MSYMKKANYLIIIPVCLILVIGFACKKSFLDRQPTGALNQSVLANKTGVEGLLIGTYAKLNGSQNWGSAPSNWSFGSVAGGEAYKGSIPSDQATEGMLGISTWSVQPNNGYVNEKWVNNYNGIGRANETLRMIPQATDLTADEVKVITAEARFLRGWFHFELKKVFANIPYVDETVTVENKNTNVPNVDASGNFINIWPQIEADFQFAADNLPETQPQAGRANKWAAMAYLAKAYLFQEKSDLAKPLFDQVITSGKTTNGKKYALVNYFSNFNPDQDNSAESVFACQASVNDGSGTNGNYGDNLNYPNSGGPGGCCGFFNPSITMANAFKTDATTGLPLFDTYNTGNNVSDPSNPYTGKLDPRIDLVMGRPGISFLDWGPTPVDLAWIRDPSTNGYFTGKKSVYAKSQTNIVSTETSFWGPTQMDAGNVNLMRFSDVLLMAAEAEVEVGTLAKALEYVNMVRNRAADPKGWVYQNSEYDAATGTYKTQTTPAGNYKVSPYLVFPDKDFAHKAIMFERWLELSLEGHRFFDLQRWDNGTGSMADILNAYKNAEVNRPSYYSVQQSAQFDKGKDEVFPLPQGQVDQANSYGPEVLKQNPGY
jgi:starch-binding outer membrane protein, SusD/RagB family